MASLAVNRASLAYRIRRRWFPAACGIVAGAISLASTAHGPGLTPDSIVYLSVAANVANGRGLTMLDGRALTVFPPGFSIANSAGPWFGLSVSDSSRILVAACAFTVVLLGHQLISRYATRRTVVQLGTGFLAISGVLTSIYQMAWSEPAFLVLTLFLLGLLAKIFEAAALRLGQGVGLVLICWLGFSFRYAGVCFIVIAVVVVLLSLRPSGAKAMLRAAIPILVLGSALPLAMVLRNRALDGTFLGPRGDTVTSPGSITWRFVLTIGQWVVSTEHLPRILAVALFILVLAAITATGLGLRGGSYGLAADQRMFRGRPLLVAAGTFITVYVAYLFAAQLATSLDPVDRRLLSPVFVVAWVAFCVALNQILDSGAIPRSVRRLLPIVALVLMVVQLATSAAYVHRGWVSGVGYNSTSWRTSELARSVRDLHLDSRSVVVTNSVGGLWAATQLERLVSVPPASAGRLPDDLELTQLTAKILCEGNHVYVALFDSGAVRSGLPAAASSKVRFDRLGQLTDGELYRAQLSATEGACLKA